MTIREMPQPMDLGQQLRVLHTDPYCSYKPFTDPEDPRHHAQQGNWSKCLELLEPLIAKVEGFNGGEFAFVAGRALLARCKEKLGR